MFRQSFRWGVASHDRLGFRRRRLSPIVYVIPTRARFLASKMQAKENWRLSNRVHSRFRPPLVPSKPAPETPGHTFVNGRPTTGAPRIHFRNNRRWSSHAVRAQANSSAPHATRTQFGVTIVMAGAVRPPSWAESGKALRIVVENGRSMQAFLMDNPQFSTCLDVLHRFATPFPPGYRP